MSAREVELNGGAPWGFRMHGGADQNQPLKISRVNPGRKASLGGIREGDVISSINGQPTSSMTNADAHAMLRTAGPVLRLGLNEDREMSPRRRSIGKGTELKRPSQLIREVQKATPQAPIYATIRPSNNINGIRQSPIKSNNISTPTSMKIADEEPRFHPTNPFYSTLPNSSPSRLPIPNGKSLFTGNSRNKDFTQFISNEKILEQNDSGPGSLPCNYSNAFNGHVSNSKTTTNDTKDFTYKSNDYHSDSLPRFRNPFDNNERETERITNGKSENTSQNMSEDFETKEITELSTITEHKISEIEEIKTIKKFILNGSDSYYDEQDKFHELNYKTKRPESKSVCNSQQSQYSDWKSKSHSPSEHHVKFESPTNNFENKGYETTRNQSDHDYLRSYDRDYQIYKDYTSKMNSLFKNESTSPNKTEYLYDNVQHTRNDNFRSPTLKTNGARSYDRMEQKSYIIPIEKLDLNYDTRSTVSESSATESDDSIDSGQEKTVGEGFRTKKYIDPKQRTIAKVSKKILKAIEKLTCNIKKNNKKTKEVLEPTPLKHVPIPKGKKDGVENK